MDAAEKKQKPRPTRRPVTVKGNLSVKYGMLVPPITVLSAYRLNFVPTGDRKKKPKLLGGNDRPVTCPPLPPYATLNDLNTDQNSVKKNRFKEKLVYQVKAPYAVLEDLEEFRKKLVKSDFVLKSPYATSFSYDTKKQRDGKLTPPYALHNAM